jgi:hypothetical protein
MVESASGVRQTPPVRDISPVSPKESKTPKPESSKPTEEQVASSRASSPSDTRGLEVDILV